MIKDANMVYQDAPNEGNYLYASTLTILWIYGLILPPKLDHINTGYFDPYNGDRNKMSVVAGRLVYCIALSLGKWSNRLQLLISSRSTLNFVERITIMQQMKADKRKVINDNSDIFSSCKCKSQFHMFFRNVTTISTLRTRSTQKEVNSTKRAKHQKSKRFSFDNVHTPTIQSPTCQPCHTARSTTSSSSEESASPQSVAPFVLFENPNSLHPNLDRAQALDNLASCSPTCF